MKELKKIDELKKEGLEKSKKIEELREKNKVLIEAMKSGKDTTEAIKKINNIDDEMKQLKEASELLNIQIKLILDNINFKIQKQFFDEIFKNLEKYNTKRIGEKTREKIENEIAEALQKTLKTNYLKVYIYEKDYCNDLTIQIYYSDDDNYYSKNKCEINIYRNLKGCEGAIQYGEYYYRFDNYKYCDNTAQFAKKLYTTKKEAEKTIAELKEKERKARDEYNNLLNYNTALDYRIDLNRIF